MNPQKTQSTETDTVPRVSARDMLMVLQIFNRHPETTFEEVRLRICVDREKQRRGTYLYATARDIATELVKLGLIEGACSARNARQYEAMKANKLSVTEDGQKMLGMVCSDRGAAYDELFRLLVAQHVYLRDFIRVLRSKDLLAPVISSMKDHVASRYSAHTFLAADLSAGRFETSGLLGRLAERIDRPLQPTEVSEITEGVRSLTSDARESAAVEDSTNLSKLILNRVNDIVIPALFRADGLGFDNRSHRALWSLGEDFKTWAIVRSHPQFGGWLIYRTATIELTVDGTQLAKVEFDHGLERTRDNFLGKLHAAYQKLQSWKGSTFVSAWELRAIFCYDNRCQLSVFNRLFDESYSRSSDYKLQLEIQRQKPQHELPIRAGQRNIGTVRVVKR
jgi:hypothetical protein